MRPTLLSLGATTDLRTSSHANGGHLSRLGLEQADQPAPGRVRLCPELWQDARLVGVQRARCGERPTAVPQHDARAFLHPSLSLVPFSRPCQDPVIPQNLYMDFTAVLRSCSPYPSQQLALTPSSQRNPNPSPTPSPNTANSSPSSPPHPATSSSTSSTFSPSSPAPPPRTS